MNEKERDVIIACDFSSRGEVLNFLDLFQNEEIKPFVKIGMELYYSCGPEIVKEIKRRGHRIFLDLKLCDIPNTVEKAMRVLANLDVDMTNVHAFGTKKMMEAAIRGLTKPDETRKTKLIAVTQLTSTDEAIMQDELLIDKTLNEVVIHYAQNAMKAGLDGVVCSPLEAQIVKDNCLDNFLTVTPGVRFAESEKGDQVRVTTPAQAKTLGSDYIVVGRPITQAKDPVEAYKRCLKEFVY